LWHRVVACADGKRADRQTELLLGLAADARTGRLVEACSVDLVPAGVAQELVEVLGRNSGIVLMAPPSANAEAQAAVATLLSAVKPKQKARHRRGTEKHRRVADVFETDDVFALPFLWAEARPGGMEQCPAQNRIGRVCK
jgi:hypothetical protein